MKDDFKKTVEQSWFDFCMTGLPSDAVNLVNDLNQLDRARKEKDFQME